MNAPDGLNSIDDLNAAFEEIIRQRSAPRVADAADCAAAERFLDEVDDHDGSGTGEGARAWAQYEQDKRNRGPATPSS